jgi:predicted dehydrogenase
MNTTREFNPTRRRFLQSVLAAGVAPLVVPGHVLGADGQTSPSAKINVGVVGVGAQGRSDLWGFLPQQDVRVTALCDINKRNVAAARQDIAKAYGSDAIKVYQDFRELNADTSIDAILMALPFHWHSIPALDTIQHGKHIYLEKPVALSFEEARRIRAAAHQKRIVFQLGTQQRSESKFRWGCELALNGRLGKVNEIHVSAPGGKKGPLLPEQPLPDYVDWNRWIGPAPATPFHEAKLQRDNHENMSNFSLGMIACWGIHHLDIAQWGNGTDATGPVAVQGTGEFPNEGSCDAILRWKVNFQFAQAAPVTFVSDGTPGFEHGIRFLGESGWVHVKRGEIKASTEALLNDPGNQCGEMPLKLRVSNHHIRNFLDAIKSRRQPLCDVDTALRSDTLCHLAYIAVRQGRNLRWDPQSERFVDDEAANALLRPRPFRGEWKLPDVA